MLLDIISVDNWGLFRNGKRPILISGPCSAESEEMIMETASALKGIGVTVLRAGLWKPRTSPSAFEGVGELGLPWLNRVQRELGMKVGVEVANAKHVEAALNAGIDFLWIGARTTVSPFAVQEIADSLIGIDIPIFIKNPIHQDIGLWIGAIERIYNAGLRKIGLIHRGFHFYKQMKYRNNPLWQVPIEIRGKFPNLPMICDPSHISGNREYVEEISRMALDIGFDGLMVESHPNPSLALSDSDQQLTPAELSIILNKIKVRKNDLENVDMQLVLEDYRDQIDRIDESLIDGLSVRLDLVEEIGLLKRDCDLSVLQAERWRLVLKRVTELALEKNIDPKFIEQLFLLIHQASIDRQLR